VLRSLRRHAQKQTPEEWSNFIDYRFRGDLCRMLQADFGERYFPRRLSEYAFTSHVIYFHTRTPEVVSEDRGGWSSARPQRVGLNLNIQRPKRARSVPNRPNRAGAPTEGEDLSPPLSLP